MSVVLAGGALALGAVVVFAGWTWAVNQATARAQTRAYEAWQQTGLAQPGWDERFIWAEDAETTAVEPVQVVVVAPTPAGAGEPVVVQAVVVADRQLPGGQVTR